MLDRLLILLAGMALAAIFCYGWRAYQRRRLAHVAEQVAPPR